jgi:hypothetical protein
MRVFLLDSGDDFRGSWTREHWDCVVDVGRAPKSFYIDRSAELRCPVFSVFDFALELVDLQAMRRLLEPGMGRVVDRFGIDWWDVISLQLEPDLQQLQLALRLAEKLKGCQTLVASRSSIAAEVLQIKLGTPLHFLHRGVRHRVVTDVLRRGVMAADLGFVQLRQVVYDKYDPRYEWRRKLAKSPPARSKWKSDSIVLLPTAYSNVTKTELSYARILPEQKFLMVLARESGAVSPVPENVETVRLASFAAKSFDAEELEKLEGAWKEMERSLQEDQVYKLAGKIGLFKKGLRWLRWGTTVRDAWLRVFETQPVSACLSADDSNPYTRIPLLLAEQKGIAAVACHHGALDFRMAFKNLRFSTYLAKGEMELDYLKRICRVDAERIRIGAPSSAPTGKVSVWDHAAPWITFFAEPYESDLWRVEPIYREVLPRLCAAARKSGKIVVLKLHPFESARQRSRLVRRTLGRDDQRLVKIMDAPLSGEILEKTWCGVTVESTVAFECTLVGIPVFLCGWLRNAYSGYAPQYSHFGVGHLLESPDDLLRIPDMLCATVPERDIARRLAEPISADRLSEALGRPSIGPTFSRSEMFGSGEMSK